MIRETVIAAINKFGTDGVITEYENDKKHIVRGLIQPLKNTIRQYSNIDYTDAGEVDNRRYLFLFNVPQGRVNYLNATVWLCGGSYWFKECAPYYFNGKPLYMRAVLSPYQRGD